MTCSRCGGRNPGRTQYCKTCSQMADRESELRSRRETSQPDPNPLECTSCGEHYQGVLRTECPECGETRCRTRTEAAA